MQQQRLARENQAAFASNHHYNKLEYLSDSESSERWSPTSGAPYESGDEWYTTSINDSSEDEVSSRQINKETPLMSLSRLMRRVKQSQRTVRQ